MLRIKQKIIILKETSKIIKFLWTPKQAKYSTSSGIFEDDEESLESDNTAFRKNKRSFEQNFDRYQDRPYRPNTRYNQRFERKEFNLKNNYYSPNSKERTMPDSSSSGIFEDDEDSFESDSTAFRRNKRSFEQNFDRYRYQDRPYGPNRRHNQRFEREEFDFKNKWDYSPDGKERTVPENDAERAPIEKMFYVEHADVSSRSENEVEDYRKKLNISITGENVPKPITKFSELCLPENLMQALNDANFSEPSPIQSQGWPIALSGRDMIGVSQTGSGKTLAYMLPAVVHAVNQDKTKVGKRECKPQVLVLGPTRELVQQIHQVSGKFIEACGLMGATVYGGASKFTQIKRLEGSEICIATPGRLLDLLSAYKVNLANCSYLVLDEADRMLDMGFEPQIRDIIREIRTDRQTLMWSATWPREIRNLAEEFLDDYIHVTIGSGELTANPNIKQNVYVVTEHEKEERFISLIQNIVKREKSKALVFVQTKRKVDSLFHYLKKNGIPSFAIHGDFSQLQRDNNLYNFRNSKSSVLIATDIAARGLDVTDIDHVVNFDFPSTIEDYIHRIGRTARGSAHGESHSFITSEHARLVKDLIAVLKQANQPINDDLCSLSNRNKSSSRDSSNKYYGRYRMYR